MGQAKFRQYDRATFLAAHPRCCYCGAVATTTDHCPPRSFFANRGWPEGFEFPACKPCNEAGRHDELVVAALVRTGLFAPQKSGGEPEWERLLRGVANNRRDILDEWSPMPAARRKRLFREAFGAEVASSLRESGAGVLETGPNTGRAVTRFMVKMGQALCYRHLGAIFRGKMFAKQLDRFTEVEQLEEALQRAQFVEMPRRSGRSLHEQFAYRFSANKDEGWLHAVVQFHDQFVFMVTAMPHAMAEEIARKRSAAGMQPLDEAMFDILPA